MLPLQAHQYKLAAHDYKTRGPTAMPRQVYCVAFHLSHELLFVGLCQPAKLQ